METWKPFPETITQRERYTPSNIPKKFIGPEGDVYPLHA